jgi:HPt (histidine-containing phosphotransfer) domain-containing protein
MALQPQQSAGDIEQIIAELRVEFLEDADDHLEQIYELLQEADQNNSKIADNLLHIKRHIHSLKGQGGAFGFPSITTIMHSLEDYFETSHEIGPGELVHVRRFIDAVSDIVLVKEDMQEDVLRQVVSKLRSRAQSFGLDQERKDIPALLVMEAGVQRSLVGKELVSCGFRVVTSDAPLAAVDVALQVLPRFAIINKQLPGISGIELSHIFRAINSLSGCEIIILTSDNDVGDISKTAPANTVIIHKDESFFEQLTDKLIIWGLFGEIA